MTDTPDEIAFWKAIGADPDDDLPRLVFADWLEERAGVVACECPNAGMRDGTVRVSFGGVPVADMGLIVTFSCPTCNGTGYIPDGRADLAAALRETADRVPKHMGDNGDYEPGYYWNCLSQTLLRENVLSNISKSQFAALAYGTPDDVFPEFWRYYPTAEDAIRDLCLAWVAVNTKREVPA